MCVCGSVTKITGNGVHRSSQTESEGEGSDRLQLIKFWSSCVPGKGVCGGAKIFGSALLQPVRSVCVSRSAFFIIVEYLTVTVGHYTIYNLSNGTTFIDLA